MAARFNPPPGWPPAPEGWMPPPGWAPDPSWPPPPPGWQLWIDDAAASGAAVPPAAPPVPPAPGAPDVSRFAAPDASATQPLPPQQDAPSFDTHVTMPAAAQQAFGGAAGFGGPAGYAASAPAPSGFGAAPGGQPQPGGWQGGPTGPDGFPPAGQPTGGKQWLIPVIIAVVALLAIFGVLIATGVIGGDDSKASSPSETSSRPTATEKASEEPSKEPSDEPSAGPTDAPPVADNGTRAAPLAPGAVATFSTWTVSMGATNQDAWGEISTVADEYYAPEPGSAYVMVPATVTFTGDDRSNVYDLEWVFVSAAGTTFDDNCNYTALPNKLDLSQELYTDATASGNLCVTVPADQVAGGVWRVEQWLEDEETYFALS